MTKSRLRKHNRLLYFVAASLLALFVVEGAVMDGVYSTWKYVHNIIGMIGELPNLGFDYIKPLLAYKQVLLTGSILLFDKMVIDLCQESCDERRKEEE